MSRKTCVPIASCRIRFERLHGTPQTSGGAELAQSKGQASGVAAIARAQTQTAWPCIKRALQGTCGAGCRGAQCAASGASRGGWAVAHGCGVHGCGIAKGQIKNVQLIDPKVCRSGK